MTLQERYDAKCREAAKIIVQLAFRRMMERASIKAAETPAPVMDLPNSRRYPAATSSSDLPKNSRCSNMYC